MRVDDDVYAIIKQAAKGQKRTISNFVEFATLQYLTSSQYVGDEEMREIMQDEALLKSLKQGRDDLENGDFTIV